MIDRGYASEGVVMCAGNQPDKQDRPTGGPAYGASTTMLWLGSSYFIRVP